MIHRTSLITVTMLALWLSFSAPAPAADPPAPDSKPTVIRWEHLAFTQDLKAGQTHNDIASEIMRLGREGWEMFSVANLTQDGTTTKTIYYFKRRL